MPHAQYQQGLYVKGRLERIREDLMSRARDRGDHDPVPDPEKMGPRRRCARFELGKALDLRDLVGVGEANRDLTAQPVWRSVPHASSLRQTLNRVNT